MILGLDIDNTITASPAFYSGLTDQVYDEGGRVVVISSRSNNPEVRALTEKELAEKGIKYEKLYLFRPIDEIRHWCPYPEIGDYNIYLWQKLYHCISEGVDCFHDDEDAVIQLFKAHLPAVNIVDSKSVIADYFAGLREGC